MVVNMAPLVLDGDTLGKRHHSYNKAVTEAVKKQLPLESVSAEKNSDVDQLFKIDMACHYKDVDYILSVLKSEDMLHISRAIKKSVWLIKDAHYAHIVNPTYLHEHLFPEMMSKAVCKLLLNIRLNLKDETRVEEFFKYYELKDIKTAMKWLPDCSIACVEKAVEKHKNDLPGEIFKRLCRKSFTVLEIYLKNCDSYNKRSYLNLSMFLVSTHTEKYLDLIENLESYETPYFGAKYTALIMKKCPSRIVNQFPKYYENVDIETFAKHVPKDQIKDFLVKQANNDKLNYWFRYENIKPLINAMPKEGKFEFLRQVFIDKAHKNAGDIGEDCIMLCSAVERNEKSNMYQWYRHAPFNVAFTELIKLIRLEKGADTRNIMFAIMLSCAGRNMQHIQTVLQYYHDKHINEPFKFKSQFVQSITSSKYTHRYDKKCWSILDEIFHSMEVYIESDNNVQNCIESIIIYKVLHQENVPEIIEKKFSFKSLKKYQGDLNKSERDAVFKYLYQWLEKKIQTQNLTNQENFNTCLELLQEMLTLLKDWQRELSDFSNQVSKIKELIKINKEKEWQTSFSSLFDINKSWRKLFFEESLLILANEEVCLNALKHDPGLLSRYEAEVDALTYKDEVSLKRLLTKLRIYWAATLYKDWTSKYHSRLNKPRGHKALIQGLCALVPLDNLLHVFEKYVPKESKIVWSTIDELELSLQKNIAKNMHQSRPQPPPNSILQYAKGDYLQFALPSLCAIFYNLSSAESRRHFQKLLEAPVSVQKHGLRFAFSKLSADELKDIFKNIWATTKNASIRAVIFQLLYDLLCREKDENKATELWQLMQTFIDSLTHEENISIYTLMSKVEKVPTHLQPVYFQKCYKFVKTLSDKSEYKELINSFTSYAAKVMEYLDDDFATEFVKEIIDEVILKEKILNTYFGPETESVIASYLLSGDNEETQKQRCDKIIRLLIENVFKRWDIKHENHFTFRNFLQRFLVAMGENINKYIARKDATAIVKTLKIIQNEIEPKMSDAAHYTILLMWKLFVAFSETFAAVKNTSMMIDTAPDDEDNKDEDPENKQWEKVCLPLIPEFGKACMQYLKQDTETLFPSLYIIFSKGLERACINLKLSPIASYALYEVFLEDQDFIPGYLTVLRLLPNYCYPDSIKDKYDELRKKILAHPSIEVKMHYYKKFGENEN